MLLASGADAQTRATQKFLTKAIEGNYYEVQMGHLAQQNAQNEDVKSFGETLVKDHSSANDKAIDAAKSVGINPPTGPNRKQKADYDKMAKKKGADFDRAFAKDMVKDHKQDIAAFKKEAKKKDAAGQFAESTLPTLQKHLQMAQSLEKQVTRKR
jgi:putative membrane protein